MKKVFQFNNLIDSSRSLLFFSTKEKQLEGILVSSLYFEEISKDSVRFTSAMTQKEKILKSIAFHPLQRVIYKVISVFFKIVTFNRYHLDYLLGLDSACKALRKKYKIILNKNKLSKGKYQTFSLYNLTKLPLSAQLGVCHLHIFELSKLKNLSLELSQKIEAAQNKESLKALFKYFPKCLIKDIEGHSFAESQKILRQFLADKIADAESNLEIQTVQLNKMYQDVVAEDFDKKGVVDPFEKRVFWPSQLDSLMKEDKEFDPKKPISVALVGVEYTGFIKEGGLAEALEGLTKGLKAYNPENQVKLIFPKFSQIPKNIQTGMKLVKTAETPRGEKYKLYKFSQEGIEYLFVDHPAFDLGPSAKSIYGPDHASQYARFQLFCECASDLLYTEVKPDVIHLHDWHVAGIASLLKNDHEEEWNQGKIPPVVFTYHNNNRVSQGRLFTSPYSYVREHSKDFPQHLQIQNDNLFVKGIQDGDIVNTVSEKYAEETADVLLGEGVSFAVREASKQGKLFGILNGSNPQRWNPETDKSLKEWVDVDSLELLDLSYGPSTHNITVQKGKAKEQLAKWINRYGSCLKTDPKPVLDPTKPFVTYVGRYDSYQKGLDKLKEAIEQTLASGGQFICMGMGEDPGATAILDSLQKKYRKGVLFIRDFKDSQGNLFYQHGNQERPGIGSLIRAASDFVFVPSRFEPCGLVQFEGWLFGSYAIGARTGGLSDTIIDEEKNPEELNGFLFSREEEAGCSEAVAKALQFYNQATIEKKEEIASRMMISARQSSWTTSPKGFSPVEKYLYCYKEAHRRSKFRKIRKTLVSQSAPKIMQNTPTTELTHAEETYLYNFYHAKELQISFDDLYKLYTAIPRWMRSQHPHPYGIGFNSTKYKELGSHQHEGKTTFSLEAPKAKKVSVVFFDHEGNLISKQPLTRNDSGVWSFESSGIQFGQYYLYEINGKRKVDPYGQQVHVEKKPNGKLDIFSVVSDESYQWQDAEWIKHREELKGTKKALSIFEIHPTVWKKKEGRSLNYKELAIQIAAECKKSGFTHVELLGLLEHLADKSWGYLPLGYFAPTSRYGSLSDAKAFVEMLHKEGIGVIIDWVPGQFGKDELGLRDFDSSKMYEPSGLKHRFSVRNLFYSFGGRQFDFSKKEAQEFLLSSARFWLKEMHVDGFRVDSLKGIINSENPEKSHQFLKNLNSMIHHEFPGVYTIAEDYSMDPQLTKKIELGGLGFDFAWDVGWKHLTMKYFSQKGSKKSAAFYTMMKEALQKSCNPSLIPYISHDELKKGSFVSMMKDLEPIERLRTQKNFLTLLLTAPFSRLMMTGFDQDIRDGWESFFDKAEGIAQAGESKTSQVLKRLIQDLQKQFLGDEVISSKGEWTVISDDQNLVHALRKNSDKGSVFILYNFTDTARENYEIKLPYDEKTELDLQVAFNTDDEKYGGFGRESPIVSKKVENGELIYKVRVHPNTTIILKT